MPTTSRPADASGQPVLSQQEALLRTFLGAWPGQGRRLLCINCGNGDLLPRLRACGFDVAACEHDYGARLHAARHAPQGTEIFAASDDHLPFDDGEFDWTLLRADNPGSAELEAAVAEARRTAARGFAVTFWNALSVSGLYWQAVGAPVCLRRPRDVWRPVRDYGGRSPACRSIFFGPPSCWRTSGRQRTPWRLPLPLGAWCVLRCNFGPGRPLTGLFLPLRDMENRLEPQINAVPTASGTVDFPSRGSRTKDLP
ncbi:hypothetical protein [uncultured Desulfovibrio sp.]|uniref:class I SAM-dependent methyltransferase n=1 Tax=uncultured Desulfovibrio sp. TaxID=167968 RepID=UPI002603705B|nr:hypothetical protein [uncultured Desulfovibrio sp.]